MKKYKKTYLMFLGLLFTLSSQVFSTDYYVDRNNGSNISGNGTMNSPWETISYALSRITGTNHTVHVAPGIYDRTKSAENWSEIFPIAVKNGFKLKGSGANTTIIDADSINYAFLIESISDSSTLIEGFSIKGGNPAGVRCENSNFIIRSCHIFDNIQQGISVNQSSDDFIIHVENDTIENNGDDEYAYGIECSNGSIIIQNNVIQNNIADGSSPYTISL